MKNYLMKRVLDTAFLITLLAVITQDAHAGFHPSAPDAGSTSLLMAIACGGLIAVRRFIKR
jgi:hypothetical protein